MNLKNFIIIWIMFMSVALLGLALGRWTVAEEPNPLHVTGKSEVDGKCYVQTWVEVTPEEYIGLDVGDEFGGMQ